MKSELLYIIILLKDIFTLNFQLVNNFMCRVKIYIITRTSTNTDHVFSTYL